MSLMARSPKLTKASSSSTMVRARLLQLAGHALRQFSWKGSVRLTNFLAPAGGFDESVLVQLPHGVVRVSLADSYWSKLLMAGYSYEPEMQPILSRLLTPGTIFLDCGANIGYWSLFAAQYLPANNIVAVEAAPLMLERLRETASLNGDAFQVIGNAIWSTSSETLTMHTSQRTHAGSSLVSNDGGVLEMTEVVSTISLTDLVGRYAQGARSRVVVKLDVEGAEIPALSTTQGVFQERDTILFYEDHGRDSDHKVTSYVLESLGLEVFGLMPDGSLTRIESLADVAKLKARTPWYGYNFVAAARGRGLIS